MKNALVMALFSRQPLTESLAARQITALSDFGHGLMRPDKWGKAEPIRTPFDPADTSDPVKWLAEPHGEFFYRKGLPVYVSGEIWNLAHHNRAVSITGVCQLLDRAIRWEVGCSGRTRKCREICV